MKYTIKNPLNSPYEIDGENGRVHVPAQGQVTDDFTDMQIHAIRAVGYFVVEEGKAKRDPLDHDDDGKKGGFVKDEPSETSVVESETASDDTKPRPRGRPRKDT